MNWEMEKKKKKNHVTNNSQFHIYVETWFVPQTEHSHISTYNVCMYVCICISTIIILI